MTSNAAVAAAIRQRLIEGRPAPLRGLGTLVRQHVASRIEERPDGTRVLLPPGETIGLAADAADQESLAASYARFRGLADDDADVGYATAMDQIEARLAATGEVRLPGVGLLRRTSGGIVLGVEADLLQAVNQTYEGLGPVQTRPPVERAPAPPPVRTVPPPPFFPPPVSPPPAVPPPVEVVSPSEDDAAPPPAAPPPAAPPPAAPPPAAPPPAAPPPAAPPPAAPLKTASPTRAAFSDDLSDLAAIDAEAGFRDEPGDIAPDESVEDAPLDEVVEDVLPAPFGDPSGPRLADLLPPTEDRRQPPPEAPRSAPMTSVDDWAEDTWTAPAFDDAPLRAPDDDFGFEEAPIEEAEFEVMQAPDAPPVAPTPPAPEPPKEQSPDVVFAPSIGPEAGVEVEWDAEAAPTDFAPPTDAFPPGAPVVPAPPGDMPPDVETDTVPDPEPEAEPKDRAAAWLWALFVLLLLAALAAAAAVWFWPEIESRLFPRLGVPTEDTRASDSAPLTVDGALSPDSDPEPVAEAAVGDAAIGDDDDPSAPLATSGGLSEASLTPASALDDPADATEAPARRRRGVAPPIDQALSPPVLAGLSAADRAAISSRAPVNPAAVAWTLVVLSTPSRADAEALAVRYRQSGYRAGVLATQSGGRAMYRVAVGQFGSRADAIRLRDRLPPQAPPDTWALDLQTL